MSDPNRKAEKAARTAAKQAQYEQDIAGLEFKEWPKIGRLNRDIVITEKIDGTNGAIGIIREPAGSLAQCGPDRVIIDSDWYRVYAQSRTRIVTPGNDNYGFAAWVRKHAVLLVKTLGEGIHFGEWWGAGINRNYRLTEKRFSLFNTGKWAADPGALALQLARAEGCPIYSVPVLYTGPWSGVLGYIDGEQQAILDATENPPAGKVWLTPEQMGGWPEVQDLPNPRPRYAPHFIREWLKHVGSFAAPGFMKPEGIVIYHRASDVCFKATIENDEMHKGEV